MIFFFPLVLCCNKFNLSAIQNAIGLSCVIIDGVEYSEYECLTGYEFIKDQTKKNILSNNGELMQKFTCKPQGCKDSASPSSASLDASLNIEYVSKYCDPAYLPGYCKPESSHVDFRCKNGFSIDERFGFLRVKCLTSYLWDTVPMCKRGSLVKLDSLTKVTSASAYETQIQNLKFCADNFPVPKNHDQSKIFYDLKNAFNSTFQPNSLISYQCLPGYFAQKNKIIQFTKCDSNGTWSSIEDCEIHKCLSKLPKRPLNGRRSVEIFFNLKGLNNQSVVNFSCNDFFEHIGRHQVYCINYEWENEMPTCVLKKNICLNKPPILFENSALKSLTKIRIKFENDYTNWSNFTHFTEAMYTCLPGFRFEDFNDIKYEYFDKLVPFKKVFCIGPNKWQSIPQCVKA